MKSVTKLNRLLDLRRHEEERCKTEVARARQTLRDAEDTLRRLEMQRTELESGNAEAPSESVGQMRTLRFLLDQVDQAIQNARVAQGVAASAAETKLAELAEAVQQREALERIVIPRQAQIQAMQRMAEQKLDDEAALTRFRVGGQNGP